MGSGNAAGWRLCTLGRPQGLLSKLQFLEGCHGGIMLAFAAGRWQGGDGSAVGLHDLRGLFLTLVILRFCKLKYLIYRKPRVCLFFPCSFQLQQSALQHEMCAAVLLIPVQHAPCRTKQCGIPTWVPPHRQEPGERADSRKCSASRGLWWDVLWAVVLLLWMAGEYSEPLQVAFPFIFPLERFGIVLF